MNILFLNILSLIFGIKYHTPGVTTAGCLSNKSNGFLSLHIFLTEIIERLFEWISSLNKTYLKEDIIYSEEKKSFGLN